MTANRFNFRAYILKEKYLVDVEILHPEYILAYDGKTYSLDNVNNSKNYILMQSTGLVDKNGKEIFEGDIVDIIKGFENFKDEVFYDEELCSIRLKGYSNDYCDFADWIREGFEFEVIGNIYENPELLKS